MSPDRGAPHNGEASPAKQSAGSSLKVTQFKSKNGAKHDQLETLRSLGLRRIGQTVEVKDTPQARGMIHRVRHLVRIEDQ